MLFLQGYDYEARAEEIRDNYYNVICFALDLGLSFSPEYELDRCSTVFFLTKVATSRNGTTQNAEDPSKLVIVQTCDSGSSPPTTALTPTRPLWPRDRCVILSVEAETRNFEMSVYFSMAQ